MKTIYTTPDAPTVEVSDDNTPRMLHAKLEEILHNGVAHFAFIKKDGSIREAYGSLNKAFLTKLLGEQEEASTEPITPLSEPAKTYRYCDLDAWAFRSYTIEDLVTVF